METISALYKPEWKEGAIRRQNKRPLSVEDFRAEAGAPMDPSPPPQAAPAPIPTKFKRPIKYPIKLPVMPPANVQPLAPSPQVPVPVQHLPAHIPPAPMRPHSAPSAPVRPLTAPLRPPTLPPAHAHTSSEQIIDLASDEGPDSDSDPLGLREWPDTSPEERRAAERFRARQVESARRYSEELERRRQARSAKKDSKEGKKNI